MDNGPAETKPTASGGGRSDAADPTAELPTAPLWVDDSEAAPPPALKKRRFGRRSADNDG
jgi:hypothetical protein